ncbi:uncharacterized protein MELLADRAFT_65080 [Melampsora larici-populina 98AG31]|uniref:Uncharacterized protein n=1 Tax=Melampsora larici-populina (strain 98AG31 / pathotype 3-4-7) TaxID=747676 RepID=F4RTX0_MELLP|nr:uncharacterized protein MELLADRAFT_65080 [Melampsora larici-populina 98AG31]EGG04188.1 hypothetical protein MELLADRAFT_65080 [Melampsora larici-populina 98AG31]
MVVATLIHPDYIFVTPGHLPEPPPPGAKPGRPVGILCLICHAGLKYWTPKPDAWLIGCPNDQKHNTRTWRCDQFNHERTLINLGVPRPIVSTFQDWGPRISPAGHILDMYPKPPRPVPNDLPLLSHFLQPQPTGHPFQGRAIQGNIAPNSTTWSQPLYPLTPSSSLTPGPVLTGPSGASISGPHLSTPPVPCERQSQGPVPKGHRKHANKKCRFQYCQACCNTYGPGVCRTHPKALSNTDASVHPYARPQSSTTPTPKSISTPQRRVTEPRCHQWAQSANSLGQRLHVDSVVTLHKNRLEQYQPEIQKKYDETKMVTVYLWLNSLTIAFHLQEIEPVVITAYFKDWPQARLEECDLMIQAVLGEVGDLWNRAISMWDEGIDAWREIPVGYPHIYSSSKRSIVLRVAKVNPLTPGLPQRARLLPPPIPGHAGEGTSSLASGFSKTSGYVPSTPDQALHSSPPLPFRKLVDKLSSAPSPITSTAHLSPSAVVDLTQLPDSPGFAETLSSPLRVKHEPDSEDQPEAPQAQASTPLVSSLESAPTVPSPSNPVPVTATPSASPLKPRWPSKSLLVSSMLAWHKEGKNSDIVLSWHKHFGNEWKEVLPTMYRYRGWINRVGYERFAAEYQFQPNAVVGEARLWFKEEFNYVARVGSETVATPADQVACLSMPQS